MFLQLPQNECCTSRPCPLRDPSSPFQQPGERGIIRIPTLLQPGNVGSFTLDHKARQWQRKNIYSGLSGVRGVLIITGTCQISPRVYGLSLENLGRGRNPVTPQATYHANAHLSYGVDQLFSNLAVPQNDGEGTLKCRLLGPTPRVPHSRGLGSGPGNAHASQVPRRCCYS